MDWMDWLDAKRLEMGQIGRKMVKTGVLGAFWGGLRTKFSRVAHNGRLPDWVGGGKSLGLS